MSAEAWDVWPKPFMYLSPPKIDSLFAQIDPGVLKGIAKKLTINLKMITAEFSPAPRPDTLSSRLKIVLAHLEQKSLIGSIDQPGPYLWGSIPMRWGPYGMEASAKVVFFGGQTPETIIGLGGSIEHSFGGSGKSPTHSSSGTGALLNALQRDGALGPTAADDPYGDAGPDWELRATELAASQAKGPLQEVEFVAKRLVWGAASNDFGLQADQVILASPLYVAQAN
ncbi:MAG TPA: SAVMC3_10250 family protein [Jatrophihabitans sp.]|jgi:hypothetical protein|uniref:DUF7019 family protein n=1 Tax=Jatrophihabitans sp. TaxID=1932789 RepID=UPI002F0AD2BD